MAPPSGPADDALVKGGPIRELLLWYEGRYGRDYVPGVFARLSPAHALSVSEDKLTLRVQQVLIDPDELNDWVAEFDVDLVASRAAREPVIQLRRIAPL